MSAGAKGCWVILSTLVAEPATRKERDSHEEQSLIIKNDLKTVRMNDDILLHKTTSLFSF